MKEIQSINLRSPKVEKPMLDYKDMCLWMSTVCAALITYLFYENGLIIPFNELIRDAGTVVISIAVITLVLFTITNWIVKFCYYRTKRKATDKVGD